MRRKERKWQPSERSWASPEKEALKRPERSISVPADSRSRICEPSDQQDETKFAPFPVDLNNRAKPAPKARHTATNRQSQECFKNKTKEKAANCSAAFPKQTVRENYSLAASSAGQQRLRQLQQPCRGFFFSLLGQGQTFLSLLARLTLGRVVAWDGRLAMPALIEEAQNAVGRLCALCNQCWMRSASSFTRSASFGRTGFPRANGFDQAASRGREHRLTTTW